MLRTPVPRPRGGRPLHAAVLFRPPAGPRGPAALGAARLGLGRVTSRGGSEDGAAGGRAGGGTRLRRHAAGAQRIPLDQPAAPVQSAAAAAGNGVGCK